MVELTHKIKSKTLRNELNAKVKQKVPAEDIVIQQPLKDAKSKRANVDTRNDDVELMIFHQI